MEHLYALHTQEASALIAMALEVNANLQKIIAQQQADNAIKIVQLESQLEAEQMNAFRCYMSGSNKAAVASSSLNLWDEEYALHSNADANTCSAQSIHDFVNLPSTRTSSLQMPLDQDAQENTILFHFPCDRSKLTCVSGSSSTAVESLDIGIAFEYTARFHARVLLPP